MRQLFLSHKLTTEQDEELLAAHGKTFHFASRFLPLKYRKTVIALYALFRTLDGLVDERSEGWRAGEVRRELDAWYEWLEAEHCFPAPREPLGTMLAMLLQ